MRSVRLLLPALVLTACQRTATDGPPAPVAPPSAVVVATPGPPPRLAALDALDAMDGRKPVPLLPMMAHHQKQNMRDHLLAVQEVVLALAVDDFGAVGKAAQRLGTSPQMAQMCDHMGSGAPGFTPQANAFHQTADAIGAAAATKDRKAVLAALGKTLSTCTGCHETWKQSVVDDATWAAAAKNAPPSPDEAMRRQHEMMLKVMQGQSPP
jgi:hypothetical protein